MRKRREFEEWKSRQGILGKGEGSGGEVELGSDMRETGKDSATEAAECADVDGKI
jgi:hypothetical protein